MNIDIKEITKIKLEKDEVLFVTLNKKYSNVSKAQETVDIFKKAGINRVLIAGCNVIKDFKIIKEIK